MPITLENTEQKIKIKIKPSNKDAVKINGTTPTVKIDGTMPNAKIIPVGQTPSSIEVSAYSNNYENLTHKPLINGQPLIGNLSSDDLNIQEDKSFIYKQNTALKEWRIVHNLNKYPSVTVIDSAGNEVIGDVVYNDLDQITILFRSEFKGIATLN